MAQIFAQRLQIIDLALAQHAHTRLLSCELDTCGATGQAEQISMFDQKKGG